jgi:hypothetical protein
MSRFSKAYHKVGGRSIFAHKIAKISKGSGTDFLATQLYSAPDACFPSMTIISS